MDADSPLSRRDRRRFAVLAPLLDIDDVLLLLPVLMLLRLPAVRLARPPPWLPIAPRLILFRLPYTEEKLSRPKCKLLFLLFMPSWKLSKKACPSLT